VKDENGDLLADSHNILNRWKNYFSQLLNMHNVSDVRRIQVHTTEPLVPGPSRLEVEIAVAKLKKYKSPGSDQLPAELIQAGYEILLSGIRKNCLIRGRCLLLYLFTKGVKTECNNYRGILLLSTSYKIVWHILLSRLSPYIEENIRDHFCEFRRNKSHQIFFIRQILTEKIVVQ
jgi:hypothetical protein